MSGVVQFEEFAGSGRGLLARPILPNNAVAFQANIGAITYSLYKMGNPTPIQENIPLDVNVVMFATKQTWRFDTGGYTFWWSAPENIWTDPNDHYRLVIKFLIEAPGTQMHGKAFLLVYQIDTIDPIGTPP